MKTLSSKNLAGLGRLAILGAALIWGSSFVILKSTLDSVPTLYLLAIRFTVGGLILLFPCARQLRKLDGKTVLAGLAMGSCLFCAYVFQTYGLAETTPGKNAFLSATYCLVVPFLYWIFRRQRPNRWNFLAAAVCLGGIGLVSLDGSLSMGRGDLLSLISGFFFALHILVIYLVSQDRSPLMLTMLQFFFAALYCWGGGLLFEEFPRQIPGEALWSLAYLCVMATCVTLLLQSFGQKHCPPSTVAVLLTLESVFGTILSVIMGEKLTFQIAAGFILIFTAILISETQLRFFKKIKPPSSE